MSIYLGVYCSLYVKSPLQCRHNERHGASNHQPHDCLFNRLFKAQIKETSKIRVTEGNSPVTQSASNAENVSIWWRHHDDTQFQMENRIGCFNAWGTWQRHAGFKKGEISFAHNVFLNCPIVVKFCIEHCNDTFVFYAKFQNDWASSRSVKDEQYFVIFEFNIL